MSKYRRSISLLLAIFMVFGLLTGGALATEGEDIALQSLPFTDVHRDNWFFGAVWYAHENGIMSGTSAATFAPNAPFTRAMVVTTLFRIYYGRPANAGDSRSNPFSDVTTQWFAPYVTWAYNNGVTEGIGGGLFGPQNNVTRQQFATMLFRYADRMTDRDMTIRQGAQWNQFTDRNQIASWAVDELTWTNYHGIITGRTATTIAPTGTASRAEAATILMRFIEGADFVPQPPPQPQRVNIQPLLGRSFNEVRHLFGNLVSIDEPGLWQPHWFDTGVMVGVSDFLQDDIMAISVDYRQAGSAHFHYNDIDGTFTRRDVRAKLGAPDSIIDGRYEYWTMVTNGWVDQGVSIFFDENDRVIEIHFGWNS
ncbi:MAG: S-layer homology domain-containing protein [Oscillospiraceae bacterium]|nr:S-layer homology domain-containing protein [Oscillospiraceae bacterium]